VGLEICCFNWDLTVDVWGKGRGGGASCWEVSDGTVGLLGAVEGSSILHDGDGRIDG
jgi:hypothetical protein